MKFIPAVIWFGISLWLLTMPGSNIPHESWFDTLQVDKWVHVSMFFLLCFLCMYPIKKKGIDYSIQLPWFLLITVAAIAYGVIMEFVQRDFIPNRSFDAWDMVADSIGSMAALIWFRRKGIGS